MPLSLKARELVAQVDAAAADSDESMLDDDAAIGLDDGSVAALLIRSQLTPSLFDYQHELAAKATDLFRNGARAMLSLPTGAGKTRTAAFALLQYFVERPASRVLWIAPTKELLWQAHRTIQGLWGSFGSAPDLRLLRADEPAVHDGLGSIRFRTIQGLLSKHSHFGADTPQVIVFDEAHQASAPKFAEALERLALGPSGCSLLGLSATPWRTNVYEEGALTRLFNNQLLTSETLGRDPVRFLQRRGVLSQIDFRFISESSGAQVSNISRFEVAVHHVERLASTARRILVFAESVAESEALAHLLNMRGIPSAHLEGAVQDSRRSAVLSMFGDGKIRVLSNQKLLAVGYDCPAVSDLVLIPKIGSAIMFEQVVGRAARGPRTGGGHRSTVWQFDDHLELHGLPKSYYRHADYQWNA